MIDDPTGCITVRTHDMKYIGQGVWRCSGCGYEAPPFEGEIQVSHDHTLT